MEVWQGVLKTSLVYFVLWCGVGEGNGIENTKVKNKRVFLCWSFLFEWFLKGVATWGGGVNCALSLSD